MIGFDELLRQLDSEDQEVQERAVSALAQHDFSAEEGVQLIAAAAKQYPNDAARSRPIAADLLRMCWHRPRAEYVAAVERHYAGHCGNEQACEESLRILSELKTPYALTTLAALLKRPEGKSVDLELVLAPLVGSSTWGEGTAVDPLGMALFPGFFDVIDTVEDVHHVYRLIQKYHAAGLLNFSAFPEFVAQCVGRADAALVDVIEYHRWMTTPGYAAHLSRDHCQRLYKASLEIEWLLDLFANMEHAAIPSILRRGLESPEDQVRLFAVSSMSAKGLAVPDAVLEDLASTPDQRWRLWAALDRVNQLDRFPTRFRTQVLLAEAEMVQWLQFPTEMDRSPEEIEFVDRVAVAGPDGSQTDEMYFFKFRASDFDDGKWFVGVAGPYPAGGLACMGGKRTFSRFKEWGSQSFEAHVRDYLG